MARGTSRTEDLDVASRLRRLVAIEAGGNSALFARRLDLSAQRWNNFERGLPLSRQVAVKLVLTVPGLTLDWLYLGRTEGLSVQLAQRLEVLPEASKQGGKKR